MATTYNYYNMNNNNMWQQMLSSGLGMLTGGSCGSMGSMSSLGSMGSMGMMSMGGSLFTNCYGDVDYSAMAGYGVINALFSVGSQAISESKASKAPKVDYENEIKNLDSQISDLKTELENPKVDTKYDTDISGANTKLNTLKTQLESETDEKKKASIQEQIDKLNGDENTEGSVKYYQKQKENAIASKKEEIQGKISDLEKKKAELQKEADAEALDRANGTKLSRTSDKKYNAKINDDGTLKEDQEYDKSDLKTAVDRFMKAQDPADKKKCAQTLIKMYTWVKNNNSGEINSTSQKAAEVAKRYLEA